MSNKLIKRSEYYGNVKEIIRNKIEKEGGINVSPELITEYIYPDEDDQPKSKEHEKSKEDKVTYEEFVDILTELSQSGYILFKIAQISDGKEKRGIMICRADTTIAFAKAETVEKNTSEKE